MISKQQQKYVQSLHNKKYRNEFKVFLVEGEKGILELIDSDFEIISIYCSDKAALTINDISRKVKFDIISEDEISKISTFKNNGFGVAIVKQKGETIPNVISTKSVIVTDGIKDPGNLGTIIRLADWYGIPDIVLSNDTVEIYNPKVIAASMGSFKRINYCYTNLVEYLQASSLPSYGAFLEGENIHKLNFPAAFNLVIGSESHGISKEIKQFIGHKITIPRIGEAESLNAAIATGIILDNIFRNY